MKMVFHGCGLKVHHVLPTIACYFLIPNVSKWGWFQSPLEALQSMGEYIGTTPPILPPTSRPVCVAFSLVYRFRLKHFPA